MDLSIVGLQLGVWRVEDVVAFAAVLAAAAVACLVLGVLALRRGRRSREGERQALNARLDSSRRLLEWQVDMLVGRVRELEERKASIEADLERTSGADAPPRDGEVIVVPDMPMPPVAKEREPSEEGARVGHHGPEPADPG